MGPDEFNSTELYYRTKDVGEFKLLPIKALTEGQIEFTQSQLDVNNWLITHEEIDVNAAILYGDELFKTIEAIQQKEELNNSLYIICEMAKRYLYLLKEKENNNEQV